MQTLCEHLFSAKVIYQSRAMNALINMVLITNDGDYDSRLLQNGRREFVPRDQVFPLFSVYTLLLLHKKK